MTMKKSCDIINKCLREVQNITQFARVAQLVEHDLAKVGVAGSSPVSRFSLEAFVGMSFFVV